MDFNALQSVHPFLSGGGEMGALTRSFDWSKTSVGAPEQWPHSLRTTVSMILTARFPMFLWWGPELIQFYNDAYRPSLGNEGKHPTALGQRGADCWPEIWSIIKPLIDQVLSGGESTWSEDQFIPIYRNGRLEEVYWTFGYSPVRDDDGQIAGVLVICQETTRQVTIARHTQQNLSIALESAQLGIWSLNPVTQLIEWDDRCRELFGLATENVIPYEQAVHSIHPDDQFRVNEAVKWAMNPESGGHYDVTYRTIGADDGLLRWVRFWGQGEFNDEGRIQRFGGVAQDVTQDTLIQQQLQRSEKRFRSLVEEAPVATCLFVGRSMIIEVANEGMLSFWGKDKSVIGKALVEAVPELLGQPFLQILDDVFTTGQTYEAQATSAFLPVNGVMGTYYFNFTYEPLRNETGEVYAILEMAIDVTEQELARQQLAETEARLRGAIELAQLGTWELDAKTGAVTYSDRLKSWFGFTSDEIDGNTVYNPTHPHDRGRVEAAIHKALEPDSEGIYDEEYRLVDQHTGHERVIHAQGKTLFDAQGQPLRLMGTAQDVTAQRQLQLALEQLVQLRTEELKSTNEELRASNDNLDASIQDLQRSNENLQQFAYVASHDLQEPLRKIQSFGDILLSQYAQQLSEGADYLNRMQTAANRMSVLIKDLLSYSRISTRQNTTTTVSLTEVLQTVLNDLELAIEESGAVIVVQPLPVVQGEPTQLKQLFQNLLSNALKFRQSNVQPQIRVVVQTLPAVALPASVRPTRIAPAYYRIDVIDNGIGFDAKYVDRIFQVFQRLHGKSQYAGTGINLAICEKVVANHGGAITAASQPGQGATFSIYLPVLT